MFVCVCKAVTDHEIRACASRGATSLEELRNSLGVIGCCGRCAESVAAVLGQVHPRPDIVPHHHPS